MKSNLFQFCGGYQSAAELLTKADLKVYAKTIITEIRKYDPDNIILMGCPHIGTRILISWQRALSMVWRM